ncbi:MAG: tetratricopeptide repeat protein [Spirochaetales bacterium]|nr:tetratricopeptide repeat protein [Spirochaetales bacterium]
MSDTMKEGINLYRSGQWTDALTVFLGIPSGEGGGNLQLAYYIGLCYARLERYDDALVYLEQVVTADTDLARVYQCRMVLAVIYTLTERTRLAAFELHKLIDSGYESPQVFSSLAYIAFEHGSTDEAIQWYEKALALESNSPTALNGLGYVLAETGKDLTRALTMCKKAVDAQGNNPAFLDSIAWIYHKLGLVSEARTYARRAREGNPNSPVITRHFREITQKAGGSI